MTRMHHCHYQSVQRQSLHHSGIYLLTEWLAVWLAVRHMGRTLAELGSSSTIFGNLTVVCSGQLCFARCDTKI